MRRVRRVGTGAELIVRRWLREHAVVYRIAPSSLPGRPDLANRHRGFAIFVHGCFWHGHEGCKRFTRPRRNAEWWAAKVRANRERDARKRAALEALGLEVVEVWECEALALERGGDVPAALAALAGTRE